MDEKTLNEKKGKTKEVSRKSIIYRAIFLFIYIVFLIYFYIYLIHIEPNHLVATLIIVFLFLIVLGPLITGVKKSMFARLFKSKKSKPKPEYQLYKEYLEEGNEHYQQMPRENVKVSLDFKYRKPLIQKCKHCGMILATSAKMCPQCGNRVEH